MADKFHLEYVIKWCFKAKNSKRCRLWTRLWVQQIFCISEGLLVRFGPNPDYNFY